MKVGILTFPNSRSYGAVLQMLALYQVCLDLGYDAEIINYYNLWMKQEKHMEIGRGSSNVLRWGKRNIHTLLHLSGKVRFSRFENTMQKYPGTPVTQKNKLPQLAQRYGAVICGSDQVWNPDITNEDLSYFLDFCSPEITRVSYAPSFGVESLSGEYAEKVRKELEKFHFLSIREETGRKLIRESFGLDPKLVLDPTLLLNGEQWQKYEKPLAQACGDYILYYTVRSSSSLWKHCRDLAIKTNMKILRIGSNVISKQFKKLDSVEYVCDIGPAQWLYLVRNAKYVVTNSFHGTAFAVNFRRNFYVEYSSSANSRLSDIIGLLDLEERVLREGINIIPSSIDYSKTEARQLELKAESCAFLEDALKAAALKQEKDHE